MSINKPFAESSAQNQTVILSAIKPYLENTSYKNKKNVLEIGSGTGQHAVYFAKAMPHLIWQCTDFTENHDGINAWIRDSELSNVLAPITLDVSNNEWPTQSFDVIYSANAVHIMSWDNVVDYFKHASEILNSSGLFILYGPFNYGGKYTNQSNERFDGWLKSNNPLSGIRDFEALDTLAKQGNMKLHADIEMPANNRTLIWKKV